MFLASRWLRWLRSTALPTRAGKPRPRRPHTFRPEVQILENRWCPNCTVRLVDEHTLQVLGDNADNNIVITDNRPGDIQVTCDGRTSPRFTGIANLQVNLGAGNDTLVLIWNHPATGSVPIVTQIDLGAGNDRFVDDWSRAAPPLPDMPMPPMPMTITTGSGNDQVTELNPPPGITVDVQFGNGKDQFTAVLPGSASAPAEAMAMPAMFAIQGGAGTDTVRALIGRPQPAKEPAPFTTPVNLQFTAGSGRSELSVAYSNVAILAPQMVALTGVQGNAAVQVMLHNAVVMAPLTVAFNGPGPINAGATVGIVAMESPVPLEGAVRMTDRSGPLGDDIRVSYGTGIMPFAHGVSSRLRGSVELTVPPDNPWEVRFEINPNFAPGQ
jgi:hypothetical protein